MSKIFLSGGLGDCIVLESHFSPSLRANLTHLYLAQKPHKEVAELFRGNPAYPKLEHIECLWNKFDEKLACFHDIRGLIQQLRDYGNPISLVGVEDWSIRDKFWLIKQKVLPFTGSTIVPVVEHKEPYAIVHSLTTSIPKRELDASRWQEAIAKLEEWQLKGIVLGGGSFPAHPLLEIRQTTITEAIRLTASASAFIGIDSCLSVAAGLSLPAHRLLVYTDNPHLIWWRKIYWMTQTDFSFIRVYPPEDKLRGKLLQLAIAESDNF